MLTAIIFGLGTVSSLHIEEKFQSYYVEFVTGTVSAAPLSIEVFDGKKSKALVHFKSMGFQMFKSNQKVGMVIRKEWAAYQLNRLGTYVPEGDK